MAQGMGAWVSPSWVTSELKETCEAMGSEGSGPAVGGVWRGVMPWVDLSPWLSHS